MLILAIIVFGMFAGWIAQLILGRDGAHINWPLALFSGLIGSFVGGFVLSLIFGDGISLAPSGLIGSIVGALIVSIGYRWWQRRQS